MKVIEKQIRDERGDKAFVLILDDKSERWVTPETWDRMKEGDEWKDPR